MAGSSAAQTSPLPGSTMLHGLPGLASAIPVDLPINPVECGGGAVVQAPILEFGSQKMPTAMAREFRLHPCYQLCCAPAQIFISIDASGIKCLACLHTGHVIYSQWDDVRRLDTRYWDFMGFIKLWDQNQKREVRLWMPSLKLLADQQCASFDVYWSSTCTYELCKLVKALRVTLGMSLTFASSLILLGQKQRKWNVG